MTRASGVLAFVPRPLRIQFLGAIYHLMSRGHRREPIFKDDHDFVRLGKTSVQTWAEILRNKWDDVKIVLTNVGRRLLR